MNEIGFSLCRYPSGQLTHGPVVSGTPTSVNIPVACPPGARFEGLFHTHPGGVAYPSNTDIRSARKVRAEHLCIAVPDTGEMRCFRFKRKRA